MDQTQTSDDAPLLTHSTPQSEQTTLLAQQKPLVTIVHASVGSGHKAAANAIAQAFDLIRSTNGIPEDVEIEVLDILDFGRIKFDGNKTAASFTGATRPIYDLTWRYTLTGHLLWGGGTAWSRIMFPAFNEYVRTRSPLPWSPRISRQPTSPSARASLRASTIPSFAYRPITRSRVGGP